MLLQEQPPSFLSEESNSDFEDFQFDGNINRNPLSISTGSTFHTPAVNGNPNHLSIPAGSAFQTPVASRSSTSNRQIVILLQQQQATLKDVLDCQKKSDDRQNNIEQQLCDMQDKVENISSQCSPPDSEPEKRKRVVTRSLSVSQVIIS